MYDNLLQLPLFQGLCKEDFTTIIERVKFHFISYKEGETIATQGKPCQKLCFLLSGEVIVHTEDLIHNFALTETLTGTQIIEPYSLFGMQTSYRSTYQAKTEVKMLSIDKQFIFSVLNNYEIFRINFLNLLSNRCQYTTRKLWETHIGTLEEKIANFFLLRCQMPNGEKTLRITMDDLGKLIDETRINVSRLLNDMQDKEIVQLKRKEIYITELERLTAELLKHKGNHYDK